MRSLHAWGLCVLLLLCAAVPAEAASLTLAWDPSPEPDVAGYTIGYGQRSGDYTGQIDVANTTEYTVTSLPDGTYYFAVQAYTHDGVTSGFSNEVVATLGTPPPTAPLPGSTSSCLTPDPFVSLGGGTCYNGGWLPPGMPIPEGTTSTEPAPAPAPAPAPSASSGSCTTPDPFVALGGGTCYNGGWLPPGMPIPNGGSTSTAPAPAPAPTSPPPSSGSCTTPDPFVTLGGGTCYNGGWLPPGMPIPSGGTAEPAPTPAPTPSTGGSCQTPDPFVTLGGGTCVNGAWLPPGMILPGDQTGVEVTATGTLHVVSAAEGLWLIQGDDGTVYTSPSELPAGLLVDGTRVTFVGVVLPAGSQVAGSVAVEILSITVVQ
ncbi:MAG TPA: fibronectin type III domain-containing protein [Vicinamibacterales bacterium]|nr:fibronectin type III domain-containing protein [Vicinamibacterales bacterium]